MKEWIKSITKENFKYDKGDFQDGVFSFYISLPLEIQKHYEHLLKNVDGTADDHEYIEYLYIEYKDGEFRYEFVFDGAVISVTDDFNCEYMNDLALEHCSEIGRTENENC